MSAELPPTPLTQQEIDRFVSDVNKPPVSIEDVYALLAEVHAGQQSMALQLNALVNVVNQVAAKVPEAMEAIEASPLGGLLKKFLPK